MKEDNTETHQPPQEVSSHHNGDTDLYQSLLTLPKVELHAHLNGCVRSDTMFALAAERGVTLPAAYFHHPSQKNTEEGLLYNTMPRSLADCFAMFAEIPKAVNDLSALRRITREALEDFAAHHVVYLELRSTPKQLLRDFRTTQMVTKREYVETILQVMQEFETEEEARYQKEMEAKDDILVRLPMTCRFLVSVDRSQSVAQAAEHVDLAITLHREGYDKVVGMDLGGNPTKNSFSLFASQFQRARDAGLCITLHCAEVPCDADTHPTAHAEARAMLDFQPHRVGHALLLPHDLQALLQERQIPVETCPTSNVMTLELARNHADGTHLTLLQGLAQHDNLRTWIQSGHPLTIATDDPGVFGTDLTKEWWLVAQTFGLKPAFFQEMTLQSLDWAFCDTATREKTQARLRANDNIN